MAENKKVSQIFEAKRTANLSNLEVQVGTAVQDAVNHYDGENKRIASFIKINKVIEIPIAKEKPALLVYVSFRAQKVLLSTLYKKLVSDL
jgi:hypothetical protein